MKILVTGAKGFVGKNLCIELKNQEHEVLEYDLDNSEEDLAAYAGQAEFVFHLAGVNRPLETKEFYDGNADFTAHLCELLKGTGRQVPVAMTSSIQAALENDYGKSKVMGENALFAYEKESGSKVYVFRLPNIYGKWCRPNYNSMVATFCHNIARGQAVTINDEHAVVPLLYIDDLMDVLTGLLDDKEPEVLTREKMEEFLPRADRQQIKEALEGHTYYTAGPVDFETVGNVAEMLRSFRATRQDKTIPYLKDGFEKKLYSTYLSYLPEDQFSYDLVMNTDERGSFTELIKTEERGQVSVNISKPGITKGNHWHHSKNEKFIVVKGEAMICLRKLDSDVVLDYKVNGDQLQVVDIPPGYTHNITNIGEGDLVTVMWANEIFDPENPDTYYLPVGEKPEARFYEPKLKAAKEREQENKKQGE